MNPYEIINGDCRDVMSLVIEPGSVDSIVTDPPYELGFMGKGWDSTGIANDPAMWRAAFECLKPGGHLLAFSGTRTYHRMVCAIEDAGFEIRDQIGWVYGSGFPKSLDVSKAIDKMGGASVAWFGPWFRAWREQNGVTQKQVAALFPSKTGGLTGCVANWELGLNMPTVEQFNLIRNTFTLPFESIEAVQREVIGQQSQSRLAVAPGQGEDRSATVIDITAASTDAARQWQGWGTALKPAWEPIVVARKPLIGTVAANVLAHGTGALNIDGCRVPTDENLNGGRYSDNKQGDDGNSYGSGINERSALDFVQPVGRWPANLIHDGSDEVLAAFPGDEARFFKEAAWHPHENLDQSARAGNPSSSCETPTAGEAAAIRRSGSKSEESQATQVSTTSCGSCTRCLSLASAGKSENTATMATTATSSPSNGCARHATGANTNSGSTVKGAAGSGLVAATRFLYRPKASKADRGADNTHPTVKPTDLMRYLCRLVTPPGGLVLDPFTGSGSTGKAAVLEGFRFVGCELSTEYIAIAEARIAAAYASTLKAAA